MDVWISALSGDNEAAKIEARQMLPRMGGAAVPGLLPLLKVERQEVWRVAYRILVDIVNEVTAAGREEERKTVTAALMTLVEPPQPKPLKEIGLRLLPIALPERYDVSPIAALLDDKELREPARAALELAGTEPARAALRDALSKTDPEFQYALLNSLAVLQDAESLSTVESYLRHSDARVRAAAARAVAWTGDPGFLTAVKRVFADADPATRRDAGEALIRLADAMMRKGGKWEIAMSVYRELLASDAEVSVKNAALAGLGRFGDETAVADIFAVLRNEKESDLHPAALMALRSLSSRAARLEMLREYQNVSDNIKLALLSVFGGSQDPLFADVLLKAWESGDPKMRAAALSALAESHLPQAVAPLIAAARETSPEDREDAINVLKSFAVTMTKNQHLAEAGRIYVALFDLASTETERANALERIYANPTPEAFDILSAHLSHDELMKLPSPILFGMAKSLLDANRTEEGNSLLNDALARLNTADAVKQALTYLGNVSDPKAWSQRFGFVTHWHIIGPFPWLPADGFSRTYMHEPSVNLSETINIDDVSYVWQIYEVPNAAGIVDLMALYGMLTNKTAFAFARIHVDQEMDAIIGTGSDDGIRIWVNGTAIHENNIDRGSDIDQDRVPIHLNAGDNDILVQITQGSGGWNFNLRLLQTDGAPLAFGYSCPNNQAKEG